MERNRPEKKGRGRPVAIPVQERRVRILESAEKLFARNGYAATSMADIAKDAEMSKRTIYGCFETKEMLFQALVEDAGAFVPPELSAETPPRESIERILTALSNYVLSTRHVKMTRLVIAEADQFPEIREHYYMQGIKRGKDLLENRLSYLMEKGEIKTTPLEETADLLFGAALGTTLLETLNRRRDFGKEAMAAKIKRAVALLLEVV